MFKTGFAVGMVLAVGVSLSAMSSAAAQQTERSHNFSRAAWDDNSLRSGRAAWNDNAPRTGSRWDEGERSRAQERFYRGGFNPFWRSTRSPGGSFDQSFGSDNVDPEPPIAGPSLVEPEATYVPEPVTPLADASLQEVAFEDPFARAVFETLRSEEEPVLRVRPEQREPILAFYKARDYEPLWVGDYGLSIRAGRLLQTLAAAEEHGLPSQAYLPPSLRSFDGSESRSEFTVAELGRLDVELTIMALKYVRHASAGRVDPKKVTGNNDREPVAEDPAKALETLRGTVRPDSYLLSLHPTHPAYLAMKEELREVRKRVAKGKTLPIIPSGQILRAGMTDDRVPMIRERLEVLGYLPERHGQAVLIEGTLDREDGKYLYTQEIADAIRAFQTSEGLLRDGIVGPQTLNAFNSASDAHKLTALALNMERWRWMPRDLGDRHIFVNQAGFDLQFIEHGRETFRTKVIVGRNIHQTPSFSDVLETIEFNPYWHVPQSIATGQYLPMLHRDPTYLDRQGFEVIDANSGQQVRSSSIDWRQYTGRRIPFHIRQPPGPRNALGMVKFLFPNKHAVYLHDTPTRNLFDKQQRMFSYGCVRVENPIKFAEVLLAREDGWSRSRIDQVLESRRLTGVRVRDRIHVHLAYFTVSLDADGRLRYKDDTYGRDERLTRSLGDSRIAMN